MATDDSTNWNYDPATEIYTHAHTGHKVTFEEVTRNGFPYTYSPSRIELSGKKLFPGGGVRDEAPDKLRFDLLLPLGVAMEDQFLARVARHMMEGCKKYPERNWEQFSDEEAVERCRQSAFRHFLAWMTGATDEDHAAAVVFNLMAAEHARSRMEG